MYNAHIITFYESLYLKLVNTPFSERSLGDANRINAVYNSLSYELKLRDWTS